MTTAATARDESLRRISELEYILIGDLRAHLRANLRLQVQPYLFPNNVIRVQARPVHLQMRLQGRWAHRLERAHLDVVVRSLPDAAGPS